MHTQCIGAGVRKWICPVVRFYRTIAQPFAGIFTSVRVVHSYQPPVEILRLGIPLGLCFKNSLEDIQRRRFPGSNLAGSICHHEGKLYSMRPNPVDDSPSVRSVVPQFRSVANVVYPDVYRHLLDFAALVNFDVGRMLSAGCIIDVDFHHGLLAATVAPLAVITLLGMTYAVAVRRNIGSERALQAIRRKHQSAVIVVTFFVYSSVSSAVFRTFACDELDDGNVYLRADYRIECDSSKHHAFQIYAGFMILVYPVGIPVLYALILFHEHKMMTKGSGYEAHPRHEPTSNLRKPYRRSVFYYEVVECCRRVLLTGAVVFIYPNTAAQISVTIVIAFTFFLVSESLRPYVSRWDSWVSRTGHVIVFLSMYVALLLKVDVSGERARDQNMFAGFLVAAHTVAIVAVIAETIALVFSLRTQETSLPSSRSFRARSFRISVDSSTEVQSAL